MPSPSFITSKLFAQYDIQGVFSERQGGISPSPWDGLNLGFDLGDSHQHIEDNLHQLCMHAQLPIPHRSKQVHDTHAIICSGIGIQHTDEADILLSRTPATSIAIRTADCLPILLVDTKHGIAAAVHAGWRGTAKNIAGIAIERMQAMGAQTEYILASLGPCIQSCCFEIDMQTADNITQSHPLAKTHIKISREKAYADLQSINRLQLQSSGISDKHIEQIKLCTCCLSTRFFSYRRDGMHSGRQLAIVALPSKL